MIESDVIVSHKLIEGKDLIGKTVIVIDTLRASTVMITALANQAKSIRCVLEPEEALKYKAENPEIILGGERHALKIDGFDHSNSPLEYSQELVAGKNLMMTTSNGTRTLLKSETAETILIGCLRNAKAVIHHALSLKKDIILMNAGTDGEFTLDDFITAGAMLHEIKDEVQMSDQALSALLIYEAHSDIHSALSDSLHYKRLKGLGLTADLDYCLQKNTTDVIGIMAAGLIKKLC